MLKIGEINAKVIAHSTKNWENHCEKMLENGEDKGSKAAARAEGGEGEQRTREKPGGGGKR